MREGMFRKKWLTALLLVLACMWAALPAEAAAVKKISLYGADYTEAKPVKIGKYYYRVNVDFGDGSDAGAKSMFERSKKAKSGYQALLTLKSYSDTYYTDGKALYYINPKTRGFCRYDISAKKNKKLVTLPKGVANYTSSQFHGLFGNNLYVMTFSVRHKLNQLLCYNIKTGKKKVVLKNQTVWNSAATDGRYVFLTKGTGLVEKNGEFKGVDGEEHRFYVYDKKTGKSWDVTQEGITGMTYAAGGGGYDKLGSFGVYCEYDRENNKAILYQYTFGKKKAVKLASISKTTDKISLMWMGSQVFVRYTTTAGKEKQKIVALK